MALTAYVSCGVSLSHQAPSIALAPGLLAELLEIGAGLDIDIQYVGDDTQGPSTPGEDDE